MEPQVFAEVPLDHVAQRALRVGDERVERHFVHLLLGQLDAQPHEADLRTIAVREHDALACLTRGEGQRGRAGTPKRVALPDGWLDSPDLSPEQQALVAQAELDVSGG